MKREDELPMAINAAIDMLKKPLWYTNDEGLLQRQNELILKVTKRLQRSL